MKDRFDSNMILYRPVGLQELELIYDSGMKAFPARLPQQPIFYPVLDLDYARQTASDWNVKSGQFAGYVTQFKVEDPYISEFEKHMAGNSEHQELWIPAEEMDEFNRHILGHIKVVEAYFGDGFQGFVPEAFGLQEKNAVAQFTLLANSYLYKRMDFYLEIKRNHKAVFLNYPFWQKYEFKNPGLKDKVLQAIKEAWLTSFPQIPLATLVLKDPTPVKPTESQSFVNAVDEDTPPVRPTDSHSSVKPPDEDAAFAKPTDSQSFLYAIDEDVSPVEQTDAHLLVNPVHEDTSSVEQTDSQALVNPVHEDLPHVKQTHARVHFSQGLELGLSGKYHEAIDELSKAVEADPDHVIAHTSLGVAFHRLREDDRALSCYEAALRIDPNYAEAHYFRANILYSQGNVREAIAGYTIAIGLKPELIEAHQKSRPQDRLTDYSPAPAGMYWIAKSANRILDLNRSLETNPRQANLFKERAAEYYRLWNYEQAIADYSSCLEIQPSDASVFHARGVAYEQLGQFDHAIEDYQRATAIDPQLSDVYIQRGITFGEMGHFRQSIASLTEGIRLAPGDPDGYFNRGTSYFQLRDFERAIEDFSHVVRLSPSDEAAYYWRGISNEAAGRRDDAIADYHQFLALSQDPQAREEIEQKLRQWTEGKRHVKSSRSVVPDEGQRTNVVPAEKQGQHLDLYDLVVALGERALDSTWLGSGVDCYGEKAEELLSFSNHNQPIEGQDFLRLASGISQTRQGDFTAFDPDATSHWLFIHAWEGIGFYMETNDPKIKKQLMAHFQVIEEVDSATPPYEGLFLRS
jgi:tetratricopeptide (TPR) repeat protein